MVTQSNEYNVGLVLSENIDIQDYNLIIGKKKNQINILRNEKPCKTNYHLIVTDRVPDKKKFSLKQKNCPETILIINQVSSPNLEKKYSDLFNNSSAIKYKTLKEISIKTITKSINSENIKYRLKNRRINPFVLLFNKYACSDLLCCLAKISWLLIPLVIIIAYFIIKAIANYYGFQFSFLCWFVEYEPNCKDNIYEELKLFAIIYSLFNFKFFYDYILSISSNIDIFQFNRIRKLIHKVLQFFIPLILFFSALIIFKEIFVFKYSFRIAAEHDFIKIASVLDPRLPFLKDNYLIFYFFALDLCLLFMAKNFSSSVDSIDMPISSNRQITIVTEAERNFQLSIFWDIIIFIFYFLIISYNIIDSSISLIFQLIFLQVIYLYLNIISVFNEYKYR